MYSIRYYKWATDSECQLSGATLAQNYYIKNYFHLQ
nr:MAG TPA: hypothetical protein [Caudoviricetes sp.]